MTLPQPHPAFRWTVEPWGHALRCTPLEDVAQHLFTTRQLELRPQTPQIGEAAWAQAARSVGAHADRLMRVKQVHGNTVRVLARGHVPDAATLERPDADAVASNEAGLALAVMVADCVPILIADRSTGAVAAIHAGWRGTCAGIATASVQAMAREMGADPSAMTAAIGPSIGPEDYEVGATLVDAFLAAGHAPRDVDRWFIRRDAATHLDLWSANRDQLAAAGIPSANIHCCGLSTLAHPGVFDSFRRDAAAAGRMAAIIAVPDRS